jgi:hypothetical protein
MRVGRKPDQSTERTGSKAANPGPTGRLLNAKAPASLESIADPDDRDPIAQDIASPP